MRVLGVIQFSLETIHNFNPSRRFLSWRFRSDYVPFLTRLMCRSCALGPDGTTPAVPGLWTTSLYVDVFLSILLFRETCMF